MTVEDCIREINLINDSLDTLRMLEDRRIATLSAEEVDIIRELLIHYGESIKQKKIEA